MSSNSDTVEILLRVMEENKTQARQSEDQRVAITGFVVLIASAIQGVLTQVGLNKNSLPLTITLIVLGLFGGIATLKLHEKARLFYTISNKIIERLEEIHPNTQLHKASETAYYEHIKNHKAAIMFLERIHVYAIWLGLHTLVIILGMIYTATILVR